MFVLTVLVLSNTVGSLSRSRAHLALPSPHIHLCQEVLFVPRPSRECERDTLWGLAGYDGVYLMGLTASSVNL